ncbi:tRNA (adenosine(37)-N6)-dimethylallyltransferase MiaA [Gangjinia marincola]|uniref:tRNA dimethylallyltransferase n=1 Tax=Gangjinia marincola TaxID=578463 RepID=A0ABN1MEU4_9FLAO
MTNSLLIVVGPTAIGKTGLGIALAEAFNAEVVSADSRQFFKDMSIGTAVPTSLELAQVKHHFIQHISIHEPYSVGDFERDAIKKLDLLFEKNPIQCMVGGSVLYVKAVLEGLDHFPKVDASVREQLKEEFESNGLLPLQRKLKQFDPVSAEKIDIQNPQRVIRALEVSIGSGQPYSSFLKDQSVPRNFQPFKIGLTAKRSIIYERINRRVDTMMENGLLAEAEALYPLKRLNALNTVGYKELFTFFDGDCTLPEAVEEIKKNTRRFAKRQLTWYRKDESVHWYDYTTPHEEIIKEIKKKFLPHQAGGLS